MTDPRLTLDDLCGVEGHPAARHDCRTADRALGIVRCPVHTDEWADTSLHGVLERMDGDPRWRCHAPTRPYEQHEFMLVCDRGHVIHPQDAETAEQQDDRLRVQARMEDARREAAALSMPDPGKPPRRKGQRRPAHVTAGMLMACMLVALVCPLLFVFGPWWLGLPAVVAPAILLKVLMHRDDS